MIPLAIIGALTGVYLFVHLVRTIFTDAQSDAERVFQIQLLAAYRGLTVECTEWDEGWVVTVNGVEGKPSRGGGSDSFRDALDKLAAKKKPPLPSYRKSKVVA